MGLEEDIKQTVFRSPYQKVLINILYSANWINTETQQVLKPYGLSSQQFNLLRILRGQHPKPSTITLLQDRMLDKMSNASRLVDKLVAKNLVSRQECSEDRRQMDVKITEQGLALLKELDEIMPVVDQKFAATLSEEEAQQLSDLLDKMRG